MSTTSQVSEQQRPPFDERDSKTPSPAWAGGMMSPVSVIIPAYNEEAGVGPQVEAIRRILLVHRITHEIIVVDDGSDDGTAEAACRAHARVLRQLTNRGYSPS